MLNNPRAVIPSEARNLALSIFSAVRDSSLRSLESHVIPAKAGIQLVRAMWTPAYAGVTKARLSFPWVGYWPMTARNDNEAGFFRSLLEVRFLPPDFRL